MFQHAAARRRLVFPVESWVGLCLCFNTQPPEGGWTSSNGIRKPSESFNTQPPEGGWDNNNVSELMRLLFQHAAARRRLAAGRGWSLRPSRVSTRSRPKAAGHMFPELMAFIEFQHAAARRRLAAVLFKAISTPLVSTRSRPKAAGMGELGARALVDVSTRSRPKAAG